MREVKLKILLLSILCVCAVAQHAAAQTPVFTRPTIITANCAEPPFWHIKVYEDDDYLFVFRHFGRAEHTPGFFVYGKQQERWVEIKQLSTEHARLGRSPGIDVLPLSVTWDYGHLKEVEYADLPLLTSGSINFPDAITFEAEREAYRLNFNSSAKLEEMLTQFWVLKAELAIALG